MLIQYYGNIYLYIANIGGSAILFRKYKTILSCQILSKVVMVSLGKVKHGTKRKQNNHMFRGTHIAPTISWNQY